MSRVGRLPRVNPFSTHFVQPGAIPYQFATPDGLAALARRLEATQGFGEIIGPHGSGKSTLLASLLPALREWQIRHVRLNTTHRRFPNAALRLLGSGWLLAIDGFEQIGPVQRWRVKRHCRRTGCGLLITAHRSMGLPLLHDTRVTPATAANIIRELLPAGSEQTLAGFDVSARLRHHRGSLRDVLFELYDRWEACDSPAA